MVVVRWGEEAQRTFVLLKFLHGAFLGVWEGGRREEGAQDAHAPRRSIVRIRLRLARWSRKARGRVRGCHLCCRYVVQRLAQMQTQTQTWGWTWGMRASLFRGWWCEGAVDASAAGS